MTPKCLLLPWVLVVGLGAACTPAAPGELRGRVLAAGAPVADARVRLQATPDLPGRPGFVLTDGGGRFVLPVPADVAPGALIVTAGKEGYKNAVAEVRGQAGGSGQAPGDVRLELVPVPPGPRGDYPFSSGNTGNFPCFQCHLTQLNDWELSTHASASLDPIVLAQLTGFFTWFDGGRDLGKRFVDSDGTPYTVATDATRRSECAECHAPALVQAGGDDFGQVARDPDGPRVVREGVTCDVCHKMRGARLGDLNNLTKPGLQLADVRLPPPGEEVLFGPYDDVTFAPTGAAYAPAMATGEACAPCHNNARVVTLRDAGGGTRTRRIFGEDTWREWRFDAATVHAVETEGEAPPSGDGPYVTGANYAGRPLACQDCHMNDPPPDPATGETIAGYRTLGTEPRRIATHAAAPLRHPIDQRPHGFEGVSERMIAWAVELRATARRVGGEIVVDVEVENRHTGHSFPSGLPDRHALLLVSASDGGG
ncbi:MAG TPA: multiheme c-type cytochrome, partial [Polyangia bacterium]|nr:multiheme c-type cytochrome [Polyangia bacterium]